MRHSELRRATWHLALIVIAVGGAASVACAHGGKGAGETLETKEARLDSLRTAQAKRQVNSGLQSVTFTDGDRNRYTRVEQMIQARFAGVQVSQNGGQYTIKIRASESFQGGTQPLVIVDGAEMRVADLAAIDPHHVIKIEVLKDAAASLYGVRGGNGVIVVTTSRMP